MAFLGQDGFVWAIGVVEDRFDPEKLGRVRVRWLGYHTEEKEKILTKDLPWAQVMQSVGGTAMAGVGDAPVSLVEGTWVVGFFRDPESLQDPVVIGTMPGMNTTTALRGSGSKKWGQSRGMYRTYSQPQTYDDGNETIEGSETSYKDFEFGFFDPTVDESDVPFPPSELTFGSAKGYAEVPSKYIIFTYDKELFHRVLNWSAESDDANYQDLKTADTTYGSSGAVTDEFITDKELKDTGPATTSRITHSDLLHLMFKTTRRITADARQASSWTSLGMSRWPDTMTYSEDGTDIDPVKPGAEQTKAPIWRIAGVDQEATILSTGYLEDVTWRDSTTKLPSYPWTRDMANPALATDDLSSSDTRPSTLQTTETGQFGQTGEWYRIPHPRVKYVKKKNLTPTQKAQAEALYNHGHYGSGIYEMDDDPKNPVGRQDIKWSDVQDEDLVIVQTPDTNRLAMGGIPITNISGNTVTTKSGFFTTADTGTGANAKPELGAGDIIQIAGVRGMEEVNGRIFRVIAVSGTDSLSIQLGTADGTAWTGPGGTPLGTTNFSAYINGGVVITDPHPVLQFKSDIRERQINIGSPDPETGLNAKFWNQPAGDFNAQYPYNHVYETESGHIREYDDTPGAERIHEYHRAGTFYEIDHAGNKVDYVKGDRYDISLNDDYVYVKGRVVHTYDNEVLIRCNDRLDLSSKWKMQIWSGGDLEIHSKRNINMKSDGDINLQADGHINLQGTALTEDMSKFKAGSRGYGERSKIKMKAGHLNVEMIGNDQQADSPGIALQSNLAPIQIKTIQEGNSILLTSAEDIEMYTQKNFYRSAYTGFIDDFAATKINMRAYKEDISIYAENTDDGHIRIKAGEDMFIESLDAMNIKSGEKLYTESTDAMNIKTGDALYVSSSGTMDFGSGSTINAVASSTVNIVGPAAVNLNSGGSATAPTAANPSEAAKAVIANISQTFELLVTDLPNPNPADPPLIDEDSHGLALNKNDTDKGSGGENIRDLQDLLSDMSSGIAAHTGTYPSTTGMQEWTGYHTTTTAGIWSGYKSPATLESDTYTLGPRSLSEERPKDTDIP